MLNESENEMEVDLKRISETNELIIDDLTEVEIEQEQEQQQEQIEIEEEQQGNRRNSIKNEYNQTTLTCTNFFLFKSTKPILTKNCTTFEINSHNFFKTNNCADRFIKMIAKTQINNDLISINDDNGQKIVFENCTSLKNVITIQIVQYSNFNLTIPFFNNNNNYFVFYNRYYDLTCQKNAILDLLYQIASTMQLIHSFNIAHCKLNVSNIFYVDREPKWILSNLRNYIELDTVIYSRSIFYSTAQQKDIHNFAQIICFLLSNQKITKIDQFNQFKLNPIFSCPLFTPFLNLIDNCFQVKQSNYTFQIITQKLCELY
eukprot:TRINITY_DN2631_c0_g1_i1.p1 TRINITY_DN2631_c0_g1~~TRINITY_DN2631_c0_g1_i1.p1  ORF type:complete len:317 (+),score=84.38 TRINITY_DN2631_c0_g1_i1:38-988(+)